MKCWAFQITERLDFNELFKVLERLPKKRLVRSPSHPVHLSKSAESMFQPTRAISSVVGRSPIIVSLSSTTVLILCVFINRVCKFCLRTSGLQCARVCKAQSFLLVFIVVSHRAMSHRATNCITRLYYSPLFDIIARQQLLVIFLKYSNFKARGCDCVVTSDVCSQLKWSAAQPARAVKRTFRVTGNVSQGWGMRIVRLSSYRRL